MRRAPLLCLAVAACATAVWTAGCAASAPGAAAAERWWGGCTAAAGRPVVDFARRGLGAAARAGFAASGEATIEYDPDAAPGLGRDALRFLYLRQCGLHARRRVPARGAPTAAAEREADCWAARTLVRTDGRTPADVRRVGEALSDAPALPGPARTLDLGACLNEPEPEPAACVPTTAFENRIEYETRVVTEYVPCTHCTGGPGGRRCAHAQDEVQVSRQVPVARPASVTRRRCD